MARIRSVKPELRTSMTVAQWPREVRYFWVLLWGYLDDHGYGLDEPRLIKPDCFPMDDDLTPGDIDKWLDLIASSVIAPGEPPPLCRFEVGGRRFLHATKWPIHQRPQHPAIPKFPVCERSHEGLPCASGDSHESVMRANGVNPVTAGQAPSGESHEPLRKPPEDLTPEQVVEQGAGSREGVAVAREARSRSATTLLGNAILDEHRRLVKPSLPRDVAQATGLKIDSLLDDPEISADEIREALRRLRSNRKWGPGMLPNLVHEVRQELAGEGTPPPRAAVDYKQAATDQKFERAMARARAKDAQEASQ
jgi:hypothetical protein